MTTRGHLKKLRQQAHGSQPRSKARSATYQDGPKNLSNKGLNIYFHHILTGEEVNFPAFLTEFADNYSSDWDSQTVYGRMDDIRTFKRTSRNISIGWTVVAASYQEASINLSKCSKLISMLYPTYSGDSASTISGSPLFKVKFGNLIAEPGKETSPFGALVKTSGLVGTIDGFSYTPELVDQGFFLQKTNQPTGERSSPSMMYAKQLNISLTFTVLHTKPLGWRDGRWRDKNNRFPYGVPSARTRKSNREESDRAGRAAAGGRGNATTPTKSAERQSENDDAQERQRSDPDKAINNANEKKMLGGG